MSFVCPTLIFDSLLVLVSLLRSVPNILFFFFFFFTIVPDACMTATLSAVTGSSDLADCFFFLLVKTRPKFPPHEISSWVYGVKALAFGFWLVGVDTDGWVIAGPAIVANLFSCLSFVFLCTNPILARREDRELESVAEGGTRAHGELVQEQTDGEDAVAASDEEEEAEDDDDSENGASDEDGRTVGETLRGLILRRLRGLRRKARAGASAFSEESVTVESARVVRDAACSLVEEVAIESAPAAHTAGRWRWRPRGAAGVAMASSARSFAVTTHGDADRAVDVASSWSSFSNALSKAARMSSILSCR